MAVALTWAADLSLVVDTDRRRAADGHAAWDRHARRHKTGTAAR